MKKLNFLIILILIFSLTIIYGCKKVEKKGDLTVYVYDNENKPIESANLNLDGKTGKTDSSGKYTFTKLDYGSYTLKISKEGFEDEEEDLTFSEGGKNEIKITLNKKEEFEEIKNYSDIDSFHIIAEYRDKKAKYDQKFEIISENYGKKEYLKSTNLNTGELYAEIFMDEKTAKIRYKEKGEFYEMKREEVGSIAESFYTMVNDLVNGVKEEFNKTIKFPDGSINLSVKKVGTEKVNNYSTMKYEYSGETTYQNEKTKFLYEIWVIDSGKYKNYPTKINAIMSFQDGSMISYTINIFELGEAKVPNP